MLKNDMINFFLQNAPLESLRAMSSFVTVSFTVVINDFRRRQNR